MMQYTLWYCQPSEGHDEQDHHNIHQASSKSLLQPRIQSMYYTWRCAI